MGRKPDKFAQEMRGIHQERRRHRARRRREDLYREDGPSVPEQLGDAAYELTLKGREAAVLARSVGQGVAREMGVIGAGLVRETGKLTVDVFLGAASLGLLDPGKREGYYRSISPHRRRRNRR